MNVPASLAVSPKPPIALGLRGALQAAVRQVSWRVVGTTLAIMVVLDAWLVFDIAFATIGTKPPGTGGFVSGAIINVLMAFCIMFTTLVADELVARGAKRLPAYAWAVVIGSAVAALVQWEVHQWLHLRAWNDLPDIPHEVATQPAMIFLEYLIWGSIIVFVYVNRRTALLATARMNVARVQRTDAQRRTLESRLQALQARVEPQFLFNTLAQVHALYESDPAKGGQMLGDLIVYLRAALPHLRDSTSTLEQELKLVGAYLSIMQVRLGGRLAFDIAVPQSAHSACVPPMILLPLLDQALTDSLLSSDTGVTIRIAADTSASKLRVEIADSGAAFAAGAPGGGLRDIQERLHGLYGDTGSLAFGPASGHGTHAVMEIPYESTQRDHR